MPDAKQASTKNYYEYSAIDYFHSTYQSDISNLWNKLIEQKSEGVVLDIGCGSGRDLQYFSGKGFDVVGLDISLNLINLAHKYSSQPVVLGRYTQFTV
jgi:2-polyprenyl-3-methyl-5-hydroxy-6-metoxy-1,4-benzoquinol methylase